jgi:hypothetical protein
MNVTIIYKTAVNDGVLDNLAHELPVIIAKVLEVPGGRMAIVKPAQVALEFCQASVRDVGSDIRIEVFARSNDPRTSTENERAKEINEQVVDVITKSGRDYSVDVRLYLMDIGLANYLPGS